MQTMTTASRGRRSGLIGWLTAALLLCLTSTAWSAAMVSNGGFDTITGWTLGGTGASYSTAQNHGTITGAGSILQYSGSAVKVTTTGTEAQSVSVAANSVIQNKADVSLWAMHQWTGSSSATQTVTITLRYADATTVQIFTGTVVAGATWASITNNTLTAFPLTLTQNVNQITVTTVTRTGNTGTPTSSLYVDDIAIVFTPAATDSLTVTSNTSVATTAQPGNADIQMSFMQLNSDATGNGNCVISSATVDDVNIATTGTIANLKVHVDNDTNFVNGVLGTVTVPTWNGQSTVVDLTSIAVANRTVTSGTPKYLWITYDIEAAATNGTTVQSSVSAIGVLAPDTAPLGGPWDSNSVLITTGLGCGECHPNPMVDGVSRDPLTGGVVGNHTKHASAQGYDCILCHLATPATPRHRDTYIAVVDPIQGKVNAKYTTTGKTGVVTGAGFVKFTQVTTPVRGNCQNTDCHGGTNAATLYGGPTGSGPLWGSTSADVCTFCHNANKTNSGGTANAYPSAASPFRSTTAAGAHAVHMTGTSNLMSGGVLCADCHPTYGTVTAAGHVDDATIAAPADVPFPAGSDAYLNSTTPSYAAGSCTVYCHGVKTPGLDPGATDSTPAWTANWATYIPGTAGTCSNMCHGLPPTDGTHSGKAFPASCKSCHGSTVTTITDPPAIVASFHINGTVEATGCTGCHGTDPKQYPPVSYWGTNKSTADGVGAHVAHLEATATYMTKEAIAPESTTTGYWCAECHTTTRGATGHDDAAYPANIDFANAVESKYNTQTPAITFEADNNPDLGNGATCTVYCHGVKMPKGDTSGTTKTPTWGVTLTGCGVCHGFPPTAGTSAGNHTGKTYLDCKTCHASTIADTANPPTLIPAFHINGTVEATGCTGCHGTDPKQYPPLSKWGTTRTTADGVGAHVAHIESTATYMTKEAITGETDATGYWCAECHTTTRGASGHDDGYPGEVAFTNAVESKYNTHTPTRTVEADANPDLGNGTTCSVYCHGAKMPYGDTLGTARTPAWGVTLTGCGVCHGFPPTPTGTHSGVTLGTQCGGCHTSTMTNGNAAITNTANHINGTLEVSVTCTGCHTGSGGGAKNVGSASPHTSTIAGADASCESCHFADHATRTTGTFGITWNATTMGTDYTVDGKIYIKKVLGTETTEAEICWNCHITKTPDISEWDGTTATYDYGSVTQGNLNWATTTWSSAIFSYKNGALATKINVDTDAASIHSTNNALTTIPTTGDAVSTIGCTQCHDVHGLNNNGTSTASAPYLRGSWTKNPFKEDGAPRYGDTSGNAATYLATVDGGRANAPRGSTLGERSSAGRAVSLGLADNDYGGWQIEQNNAGFTDTGGYSSFAGLCQKCHTAASLRTGTTWTGHGAVVPFIAGDSYGTVTNTNIFKISTRRNDGGTTSGNWQLANMGHMGVVAGQNGTAYIGGLRSSASTGGADYLAGIIPAVSFKPEVNGVGGTMANMPNKPASRTDANWNVVTDENTSQNGYHRFPCSKCHNPHASRLPRLMITNCLDVARNNWDDPANGIAGIPDTWHTSTAVDANYVAKQLAYSPTAANCHRYVKSTDANREAAAENGWNTLTPW